MPGEGDGREEALADGFRLSVRGRRHARSYRSDGSAPSSFPAFAGGLGGGLGLPDHPLGWRQDRPSEQATSITFMSEDTSRSDPDELEFDESDDKDQDESQNPTLDPGPKE